MQVDAKVTKRVISVTLFAGIFCILNDQKGGREVEEKIVSSTSQNADKCRCFERLVEDGREFQNNNENGTGTAAPNAFKQGTAFIQARGGLHSSNGQRTFKQGVSLLTTSWLLFFA